MNKKALLIGINYSNTQYSLPGCANDVRSMDNILFQHFDFQHRRVLIDKHATTSNIVDGLEWLSRDADISYVQFSGHGSMIDSKIHLLPYNDNVEVDITPILERIARKSQLTIFLDCCRTDELGKTNLQLSNIPAAITIYSCSPLADSYDVWQYSQYMGIATFWLQQNLRNNNWDIDYKRLILKVNRDLKIRKYKQELQLCGDLASINRKFLR